MWWINLSRIKVFVHFRIVLFDRPRISGQPPIQFRKSSSKCCRFGRGESPCQILTGFGWRRFTYHLLALLHGHYSTLRRVNERNLRSNPAQEYHRHYAMLPSRVEVCKAFAKIHFISCRHGTQCKFNQIALLGIQRHRRP